MSGGEHRVRSRDVHGLRNAAARQHDAPARSIRPAGKGQAGSFEGDIEGSVMRSDPGCFARRKYDQFRRNQRYAAGKQLRKQDRASSWRSA